MNAPCIGCKSPAVEIQPGYGLVGTELHSMLALLGMHPDAACDCVEFAAQMDAWGIEGCFARRDEIIAKLRLAQTRSTWLQHLSAAIQAIRIGFATRLNIADPVPSLVDEAIRRAARKIGREDPGRVHRSRQLPGWEPSAKRPAIPLEFNGLRNLAYHIWPTKHNDNWRWNVRELRKRIDLFNGVRSIGIVTDEATVSAAEVRAEFAGTRVDHWIELPNNPKLREGVTFHALLRTLPNEPSVTCYAHAKGVRHHDTSITLPWAEMMYRTTFDHWPRVLRDLESFPITGTFKRLGQFRLPRNHCWHYSGTFFWFRTAETFARPEWLMLHSSFFAAVEAWPANVYRPDEAGCLFGNNAGDLYQTDEIARHVTALKEWETVNT